MISQILKRLKSSLQIKRSHSSYTLYFDALLYAPEKLDYFTVCSQPVLLIDLSGSDKSNIFDFLKRTYSNIRVLTGQSLSKYTPSTPPSIVFIYSTDSDIYAKKIQAIMPVMPRDCIKVILYNNQPSILYQSLISIDYVLPLPVANTVITDINETIKSKTKTQVLTHLNTQNKILVVDDNPKTHELFDKALKPFNLEIIHAHTGKEAVSLNVDTSIIMAFIDEYMPLMDGHKTSKQLKENSVLDKTTFILLTNNISLEKTSIFDDVLFKPLTSSNIQSYISQFLEEDHISSNLKTPLFNVTSFNKSYVKQSTRKNIMRLYMDEITTISRQLDNGFIERDDSLIHSSLKRISFICIQLHLDLLYVQITDLLSKLKDGLSIYQEHKNIIKIVNDTLKRLKEAIQKRPSKQ